MRLQVFILFLIAHCSSDSFAHVVRVSVSGKNEPDCLWNSSLSCETLDFVVNKLKDFNSTTLLLSPGLHVLNHNFRLENVHDFALLGSSDETSTTSIQCNETKLHSQSLGFSFIRSSRLSFKNIKVTGCRYQQTSTSFLHKDVNIYTGMFFAYCMDLEFVDVIIQRNLGFGVTMYDVGGILNFTRAMFIQNTERLTNGELDCPLYEGEDKIKRMRKFELQRSLFRRLFRAKSDLLVSNSTSGGGLYIEYTVCGALPPFNCSDTRESQNYNNGTVFLFQNCTFTENVAEYVHENPVPEGDVHHIAFGRGGGLSFFFKGKASNNVVLISNSTFSNNCALWGAGMFTEHSGDSQGNDVYLDNFTFFENNNATLAGGGMRVCSLYDHTERKSNRFGFGNITFYHNGALWGGGLSIAGTLWNKERHRDDNVTRIVKISDCVFKENIATVGSAIGVVSESVLDSFLATGLPFVLLLTSCVVNGNTISGLGDIIVGQGALYSQGVPVKLKGGTIFEGNTMTAIVMVSAPIHISGKVIFRGNSGRNGGAIALYSNSWIGLAEGSELLFLENRASNQGGAIYCKLAGPERIAFRTTELMNSGCFIRYDNSHGGSFNPDTWNCKVIFNNNTAENLQGKSIYATTLQNCRSNGESRYKVQKLSSKPFVYDKFNDSKNPHVVTSANKISFHKFEWKQSPSMLFSPHLNFTDELSNRVVGVVNMSLFNTSDVSSPASSRLFVVEDKLRNISFNGKIGSTFKFKFYTATGQIVSSDTGYGTLQKCPLGYFQPPGSSECQCLKSEEGSGVIDCKDDKIVLLNGHWGYQADDHLRIVPCPTHYCKCHHIDGDEIDYRCLLKEEDQCAEGRTGILCSKCKDGLSVTLGSEVCVPCSKLWALLFIPLILGLSALVVGVMYFNIDAFSGYLNAYVYSYQIVTLLLNEKVQLDAFIGFIIGLTGIAGTGDSFGTCLLPNLNDMEKLGINFGLATYTVVFTIFLGAVLPNRVWYSIFTRGQMLQTTDVRNRSFGRAFAFVCVFCYSWYTRVAIAVLHPITIKGTTRVFYYAHDVYFGTPRHIIFGVVAILTIIFVVLGFPIVLIFPSFFVTKVRWIRRAEFIVDNLRDCFKNKQNDDVNRQFFAAFYFIARLLILIPSTLISSTVPKLIVLGMICVLLQFTFCWFQPYKMWTMNLWDSLLLLNLSFISLVGIIQSVPYATEASVSTLLRRIVKILVYVPFVTILLRLIAAVFDKYQNRDTRRRANEETSVTSVDALENVRPRSRDGEEMPVVGESADEQSCSCLRRWRRRRQESQKRGVGRLPYRVQTDRDFHYQRVPGDM